MKAFIRFSLVSLLFVLFVSISTCSATESDLKQAEEQIKEDWELMLCTAQTQNEIIFFALDQLDAYVTDPSWSSLTNARIACIAASRTLSSLEWPKYELSTEQRSSLSRNGVPLEILKEYYTLDWRSLSVSFIYMHTLLEEDWLETTTVSFLENWSSGLRGYLEAICHMIALETNYLYSPIIEEDEVAEYWQTLCTHYPSVFVSHTVWIDDQQALEQLNIPAFDAVTTASSAWKNAYYAHQSSSKNSIYDKENGTIPKPIEVTGLPKMLPFPAWYDPETAEYYYFYYNNQGKACIVDIGTLPATFSTMVCQNVVSLSEVEEWITYVESYGATVTREANTWHISMEEYSVEISWEDCSVIMLWDGMCDTIQYAFYFKD